MQQNLESGSLVLGPPDGASWIWIVPIPPRPGMAPEPDLMDRALEAVQSPAIEWHSVREMVRYQQPALPAAYPFRIPGMIGTDMEHKVQIHFLYKDRQPLDALYAIEQAEGGLPPALAGAALAAAHAKRLPTRAPVLIAQLCAHVSPPDTSALSRMNRIGLDRMVDEYLAVLNGDRDISRAPGSSVDRARYWLLAGQRLWQPTAQARIALNHTIDPRIRDIAAATAAAWLDLQDVTRIEVVGIPLRVTRVSAAYAWSQVMEWTLHRIPPEALRFLAGSKMPEGYDTVGGRVVRDDPAMDDDADLCRGLASALLREADEEAEFVPNGAFVLTLPDGYPLRRWGVTALRVWADPGGLWLGVVTKDGETGSCFRWKPHQPLSRWLVDELSESLLQATLAALWRDLRVAGEEVMPPARAGLVDPGQARRPRQGNGRRRRRASRTLPSPSRPGLSGIRTWGSDEERETIQRRAHGVRGHLRQLRAGHRASDEARKLAVEFGIVIPAGRTFVRPHVRGNEPGADEKAPGETLVKARGLASVMTLVASTSGPKGKRQ